MDCLDGESKKENIIKEGLRCKTKVIPIAESRLRLFGHVERREDGYVGQRVLNLPVEGVRPRGRPKRQWITAVREDILKCSLQRTMVKDRQLWRSKCRMPDPALGFLLSPIFSLQKF